MYFYETHSKQMSVSAFLNIVHGNMINQFKFLQNRDLSEANTLQQFLQQLKSTVKNNSYQQGILPKQQMDLLLSHLSSTSKGVELQNKLFFKNWGKNKGIAFENDLIAVIEALYEVYDLDKSESSETIGVGDVKSSISNYIDKKMRNLLIDLGYKGMIEIKNGENPNLSYWVLPEVQQKVDVQGLNLTIDINLLTNSILDYILKILNSATISAKSYASIGKREGKEKLDEVFPDLHIGKSNPYRAIIGALNYADNHCLGTHNSAFYAGYFAYFWHNQKEVGIRFFQLRYMYELMGTGILNSQPVKFFIYNDPTGDGIFVDSVANLVYQILTDESLVNEDPFGAITIKKSYMRERKLNI